MRRASQKTANEFQRTIVKRRIDAVKRRMTTAKNTLGRFRERFYNASRSLNDARSSGVASA
jgi:archaellum component FlaC